MYAMILAAGFGERLRPYTLLRPKPLFPVCNQPLLDILLEHLARAGFRDVVVNTHHLADQIKTHIKNRTVGDPRVIIQEEDTILGTGGGIRMARPFFEDAPVLVWNGDIYATIDPAWVMEEHRRSGAAATLVVHDHPRFNNVAITDDDRILGFGDDRQHIKPHYRSLAFTGIQVLEPDILKHLPAAAFASIIDCYRAVIRKGGHINALFVRDHFWCDIGTPADYLALHQTLLKIPETRLPFISPTSHFFIAENAQISDDVRLSDWAVIGSGAIVASRVSLSRVVVWNRAEVASDSDLSDLIVS